MANELKDIAQRLNPYSDDGWEILTAEKRQDGGWNLVIRPVEEEPKDTQEATNDND